MTAYDVAESLLTYLGGSPDGVTHGDIRRAITAALREIPTLHDWTAFVMVGRLFLNAPYSTGTIEYDHTGGTYERQMTLTDGTWPTWIERAYIRIGLVAYYVDRRISDTVITLDANINPGADIAAETTYEAIQDSYLLPSDFSVGDRGLPENNWGGMEYMRPDQWLAYQRFSQSTSNSPRCYSFTGDPKNPGRLVFRIFPPPSEATTLDYLYHRKPRAVNVWEQSTGKVTTSSATVTLDGATFKAGHVGSILRVSDSATVLPTSIEGLAPYSEERTIIRLTSTTEAVVDDAFEQTHTSVTYRLSDPVDIEPSAMYNCFYAACIRHLCIARNRKELPDATANWRLALNLAKESDMRDNAVSRVRLGSPYMQRNIDMPLGPQS